MPKDGSQYPVRLTFPRNASGSWWRGVDTDGGGTNAVLELRRSATPEETARFETELAKSTAPTPAIPMCPKCAVRKDGCCSDCRLQEVTPLAVGQRWVSTDYQGDPECDDVIMSLDDGTVTYREPDGRSDPDASTVAKFRARHPRLRLPEELEPAPAPVSIPLKIGDSFVMETDGPNVVGVWVSQAAPTPPAEPKTSLPVLKRGAP